MKTLRYLTVLGLSLAVPALAASHDDNDATQYSVHKRNASPLVDKVRRATSRFRDINVALSEHWVPGTPCVSGPNSGAMGVHFVLPERLGDGTLNADQPEALIYEPMSNGAMRLVGVEFIVLANTWTSTSAPSLDGHLMNYVGEPNRYGLPAFYELHVWAWDQNPNGNFADWNTQVNCDKQTAE
jgi:hypothetical protein